LDKLILIAHSYHKKTQSCNFLVEYLKTFFDVEVVYDEEWETGKKIDWASFDDKYKAVVIWQMFPEKTEFEKLKHKNVIFFPMYDQVANWHFSKWLLCKNIKIVSFVNATYKKLKKFGFNVMYVQYFIEPKEFSSGKKEEIFFWQRLTKINIKILEKIFKNQNVKIHIHKAVDPGQKFIQPTQKAEEKFKITYSEWVNNKEELQDIIQPKGIYIAPRFTEGIGMSFLEAMAQGKLVIANNKPTMNEYIKNGKTGFLCSFKYPHKINLKNVEEIQKNVYEYAKKGYGNWLIERKRIIEFINEPPEENKLKLWTEIFLPFLLFDMKKIIRLKLGSNPNLIICGKKIW
jgi:glycosyltransferase involved in cell wall biosynthesis